MSPSTSRLGGGARPSRRLGAAAPLGATRPSASSFIGQKTAAPRAAIKIRPDTKPPCLPYRV
jgi:hypothetical protein